MYYLIFETALLVLGTYFLATFVGCFLHRIFIALTPGWSQVRGVINSAEATTATGAVAATNAATNAHGHGEQGPEASTLEAGNHSRALHEGQVHSSVETNVNRYSDGSSSSEDHGVSLGEHGNSSANMNETSDINHGTTESVGRETAHADTRKRRGFFSRLFGWNKDNNHLAGTAATTAATATAVAVANSGKETDEALHSQNNLSETALNPTSIHQTSSDTGTYNTATTPVLGEETNHQSAAIEEASSETSIGTQEYQTPAPTTHDAHQANHQDISSGDHTGTMDEHGSSSFSLNEANQAQAKVNEDTTNTLPEDQVQSGQVDLASKNTSINHGTIESVGHEKTHADTRKRRGFFSRLFGWNKDNTHLAETAATTAATATTVAVANSGKETDEALHSQNNNLSEATINPTTVHQTSSDTGTYNTATTPVLGEETNHQSAAIEEASSETSIGTQEYQTTAPTTHAHQTNLQDVSSGDHTGAMDEHTSSIHVNEIEGVSEPQTHVNVDTSNTSVRNEVQPGQIDLTSEDTGIGHGTTETVEGRSTHTDTRKRRGFFSRLFGRGKDNGHLAGAAVATAATAATAVAVANSGKETDEALHSKNNNISESSTLNSTDFETSLDTATAAMPVLGEETSHQSATDEASGHEPTYRTHQYHTKAQTTEDVQVNIENSASDVTSQENSLATQEYHTTALHNAETDIQGSSAETTSHSVETNTDSDSTIEVAGTNQFQAEHPEVTGNNPEVAGAVEEMLNENKNDNSLAGIAVATVAAGAATAVAATNIATESVESEMTNSLSSETATNVDSTKVADDTLTTAATSQGVAYPQIPQTYSKENPTAETSVPSTTGDQSETSLEAGESVEESFIQVPASKAKVETDFLTNSDQSDSSSENPIESNMGNEEVIKIVDDELNHELPSGIENRKTLISSEASELGNPNDWVDNKEVELSSEANGNASYEDAITNKVIRESETMPTLQSSSVPDDSLVQVTKDEISKKLEESVKEFAEDNLLKNKDET